MADWQQTIDNASKSNYLLAAWNKVRVRKAYDADADSVYAAVILKLDQALTPTQIGLLKDLLTDESMDDQTSLNYLGQLRQRLVDVDVIGGHGVPQVIKDQTEFPNWQWRFIVEARLIGFEPLP
jgi:hypothetical protein